MTEVVINGKHVPTPELEKRKAIIDSGKAAVVQDFFDWLKAEGVIFAQHGEPYEVVLCCRVRNGYTREEWTPQWRSYPYESDLTGRHEYAPCNPDGSLRDEQPPIVETRFNDDKLGFHRLFGKDGEAVLAEFFDIDLQKIDAEQRALLDAIREAA